jgi:dinuclear metal center YbgI/SA1388 family protein
VAGRDDLVSFCDELLEIERFEDYGPNGLQVPGRQEVEMVATGVSANRDFLVAGVESGADLLIAHHGLFFGDGGGGLTEQLAARLRIVLEAEVSVAGYHLPLDAHREIGNNALLCVELGLEPDPVDFGSVKGRPIGVVGVSEDGITAAELVQRVSSLYGREPLHFDSGPETVRRVGIVTGAGSSLLAEAGGARLDAFLTGEPAEQAMGDARELGVHFIAAGHYATERSGVRRLGELLAERFGIEHRFIDVPNPV